MTCIICDSYGQVAFHIATIAVEKTLGALEKKAAAWATRWRQASLEGPTGRPRPGKASPKDGFSRNCFDRPYRDPAPTTPVNTGTKDARQQSGGREETKELLPTTWGLGISRVQESGWTLGVANIDKTSEHLSVKCSHTR